MRMLVILFLSNTLFAVSPPIDLQKARAHIDRKFAEAHVEVDPFPHLVIHDILPPELYQQVQNLWPDSASFCYQHQTNRHLFVTQGCSEWMPITPEQRLFWRTFGEIVGRYIKQNIKKSLMPYLDWKFPNLSQDEIDDLAKNIHFVDSRQDSLMEHHAPYSIGAHLDQDSLFATALLYCPNDSNHRHLATALYESANGNDENGFYKPYPIRQAKTIDYVPNTLLVMLQNPWQIHSSPWHLDQGYVRKMYGMFIQIEPELIEKINPNATMWYGSQEKFSANEMYFHWEARYMKYLFNSDY